MMKPCDDFESREGTYTCANCGAMRSLHASPTPRRSPDSPRGPAPRVSGRQLHTQQQNLTRRYGKPELTAPQKKRALEDIGIEAFTENGETYIKLQSVEPNELRELADALEKFGVSKFRGTFSYPKQ